MLKWWVMIPYLNICVNTEIGFCTWSKCRFELNGVKPEAWQVEYRSCAGRLLDVFKYN